jgi:hypothetical protein
MYINLILGYLTTYLTCMYINLILGYCEYQGQRHNVGEKWDVGCQYNCVCDDGVKGHYTCVEKYVSM